MTEKPEQALKFLFVAFLLSSFLYQDCSLIQMGLNFHMRSNYFSNHVKRNYEEIPVKEESCPAPLKKLPALASGANGLSSSRSP